ncbi:TetR/AcrR family transcriptional regulator [Sphingosinicella microcystinivorans]|jgi:AcrR family transcriptional regulator|uniref:TetR/AcrR family transcriptional regulator n=1 Tax=Sphingosinicella microcystinivorans TaxID=335406 RepID=UPI0022F3BCB0|nr:TetR/AcrR family transcriptional regulator [Sphingosinicella microcystinivorans]WBX84117.1 TetR/AcrR family transcriptional regulator [Sphingosinicella microcystinivorans]
MRRKQEDRSKDTVERLMAATVQSLQELGYRQTTLAQVAARARVTSGAIVHHFPDKAALFAAVHDYVFERLIERYEEVGRSKSGLRERWDAIFECFWSDITLEPMVTADIELSLAGRVDPSLSARFEETSISRITRMSSLWRDLFTDAPDGEPDLLVELTMYLTRGLWSIRRSPATEPWIATHLAKWKEIVEAKLGIPAATDPK